MRQDGVAGGLPLVQMRNVTKDFAGTRALADISVDFWPGEVHAVVGENGAGKSTLMRVLAGLVGSFEGQIEIAGKVADVSSPAAAQSLGIAMIQQELSLVPGLCVSENIYLGIEPTKYGLVDKARMHQDASNVLARMGCHLDSRSRIRDVKMADRQLVEIAKGLARNPRVLILDEPTSALAKPEIAELLRIVRSLADAETACVYISHKLDEVFAVADRITVLRDGVLVRTAPLAEWTQGDVIVAMVGRELERPGPTSNRVDNGEVLLRVHGLARRGSFSSVSFELHRGEILGIAGLVGAGRTEVAEAIFGLQPADAGTIEVRGFSVRVRRPQDALRHGIAMVPEDRRRRGLVLQQNVSENLSLPWLRVVTRLGWVNRRAEARRVERVGQSVTIRAAMHRPVRELSGGNQQKVVIGKWLEQVPAILILDEPTRGIDVGAKLEIHRIIESLASDGIGIIVVSSELPEILRLSDRILVMRSGTMVGELSRGEASEEAIMALAAGGIGATGQFLTESEAG